MPSRRLALISALAAAVAAAAPALAAPAKLPAQPGDMSLGSPKAKIQVVEYASMSCSHCASFHTEVFPAFKAKYVDTGKVRFTLREMLTPPAEVAAAGFLMARCAGPSKYFKVVGEVFESQARWNDGDLKPIFVDIAKANGLSEAQFDACLTDQASLEALNGRVKAALDSGVNSTPTLFVNGVKFEGEMSLQQLDAAIAAAGK
ncbi:DsbA family protein [Phenylobacterium sp. LjRoot219]|uniref:DsbA family protein n=1 Tax=Phenylobacterium sp. LjRoot219 TaxID=3342283 RepID=UPI003F4F75BF